MEKKLTSQIYSDAYLSPMKTTQYTEYKSPSAIAQSNVSVPATSWDADKLRPQVLINSDQRQTLIADYNVTRKEIVDKIIYEASKTYTKPDTYSYKLQDSNQKAQDYRDLIFNQQNANRIFTKVESIHNVDHNYVLHELHHLERPIVVKTAEEVTRYWEAKEIVLLSQKRQLEEMIQRGNLYGKHERKEIKVQDQSKTKDLELKIQQLLEQIELKKRSIMELEDQLSDFESQLTELQNSGEMQKQSNELEEMKKKFKDLNSIVSKKKEELMMAEAEIGSLKNRQVTVSKAVTTSKAVKSSNSGLMPRQSQELNANLFPKQ